MAQTDPSWEEEWRSRVLERLLTLKREDESDAAFARRLGLQPQHLSNYRSGRHGLSLQTAVKVAQNTGLSLDWLLRGEGEPFGPPEDYASQMADASVQMADASVQELKRHSVALLRKLDELRQGGRIPDEHVDRFQRTLDEVMEPLATT